MYGTSDTPDETDWRAVFAGLAGGIALALQIGKVSAALPLLRVEYGADVQAMSVYVGLISLVAATGGFWFGTIASRFDARRVAQSGLAITALGSLVAIAATSTGALMASRAIEAVGFSMTATSIPGIIQAAAARRHKGRALAIWAMWMPTGIAAALALSWLLIGSLGWRAVYGASTGALMLSALGLQLFVPALPRRPGEPKVRLPPRAVLHAEPLKVTLIFFNFSASSLIALGFLPTILVDDLAMREADAAALTMFAALAMLPSNLAAGWLLDRGADARALYVVTLAAMAVFALLFTSPDLPAAARLASIYMFSLATGVPPALIWASISPLARQPGEPALLSGLFYQGAGLGQVVGPIAAGWAVTVSGGWHGAGWTLAVLVTIALAAALTLRRAPS